MNTYIVVYLGAMVLALFLTPLVARLARRWHLLDQPNARKVHAVATPRLGGVAIVIAMMCMVVPVLSLENLVGEAFRSMRGQVMVQLLAALAVFAVGFIDDLRSLPSIFKLIVVLGAAMAVCASGSLIGTFALGDLRIDLGWMAWPVTLLWIAGVTVGVNFIDGLDGLAAGITAIACGVIAALAAAYGQFVTAVIALSLLGSLTGFLFHNFHPAKIFMGDGGSMFIGFMLASSSVMCASEARSALGLLLPALALGIPILDTTFTMFRRMVLQRLPVFAAERGHIHHRLMSMGLRQKQVVLLLYAVTLATAGTGLLVSLARGYTILWLGCVFLLPLALFRVAGMARVRGNLASIRRSLKILRSSRSCRQVFAVVRCRLALAKTFQEWWKAVCESAEALQVVKIEMPTGNRDGTMRNLLWCMPNYNLAPHEVVRAHLPVRQRRTEVPLSCEVEVSTKESLEVAGHRMMLFSRLLEEFSIASLPMALRTVRFDSIGAAVADEREAEARELEHRGKGNGGGNGNGHGNGNGNGHGHATGNGDGNGNGSGNGNGHGNGHGKGNGHSHDASPVSKAASWRQKLPFMRHNKLKVAAPQAAAPDSHRPARRIAVVHDFLYTYAGAERVLEQILKVYPEADIFSLFDFLPEAKRGFLQNKPVKTSFIQKLPMARSKHRAYLPLMPLAIEQLNVSDYDLVISSSYLAAKGVITRPDQLHICYCHTPPRFAWDLQGQYLSESGLLSGIKSFIARVILHYIRGWDTRSSNGVDVFLTNSNFVGRRIHKVYRRTATTVYPPVDVEGYTVQPDKEDFYLTMSRLVPYKRIELIVEAFAQMPDRRLVVIGEGPDYEKIKAKAGPNVSMLGFQPHEHVKEYMQRARAFVFAAEEDFGIVPVEAQACGTPVIAYARGGVTESVIDGRTGVFFMEQTVPSIVAAVKEFEASEVGWNPAAIRANAERFSAERFRDEFKDHVEREWLLFKANAISQASSRPALISGSWRGELGMSEQAMTDRERGEEEPDEMKGMAETA